MGAHRPSVAKGQIGSSLARSHEGPPEDRHGLHDSGFPREPRLRQAYMVDSALSPKSPAPPLAADPWAGALDGPDAAQLHSAFERDPAVRREVEVLLERQPDWLRTLLIGHFVRALGTTSPACAVGIALDATLRDARFLTSVPESRQPQVR